MADNYFSYDNLSELTDIESHLSFAKSVLAKHAWENSIREKLEAQITAIQEKQKDKTLNITVIGEFNAGKSTFINALIGQNLLADGVIQGTTVAIALIEYSPKYYLHLHNYNGLTENKLYEKLNSLRTALLDYTTNPQYANTISYITVGIPSDILKNGYRIIDTPGTNSVDLWHEEITKRAISELSDLSLILVDATRPLPQTLINFVDNALGHAIWDCAFVITKVDLIPQREIDRMVQYILNKIVDTFDFPKAPLVCPFVSIELTRLFDKSVSNKNNPELFQLTTTSLQSILEHTAKQKVVAQARKLMIITEQMYGSLNENINAIAQELEKELKLLHKSKVADLGSFISSQTTKRQQSFEHRVASIRIEVENRCSELVSSSISRINGNINSRTTLDGLSSYIKNGDLKSDILSQGESMVESLETVARKVKPYHSSTIKDFQKAFESEFQRLKILAVKMNIKVNFTSMKRKSHSANIGPVATLISEELSKENWAIGGGMAAGAAIGTAILPGIGTAIGWFLGGMAGGAMAPDTDEVKGKVKSKLSTPLRLYFNAVANDCLTDFNTYVRKVSSNIASEIRKYETEYRETIEARIAQWEQKRTQTTAKIKEVKKELTVIQHRRAALQSLIQNIK